MGSKNILQRAVLPVAIMAWVLISTTACHSDTDADISPSAPGSPSAYTAATPQMEALIDSVNKASIKTPDVVFAAGARPTIVDDGTGPTTMVIRDEAAGDEWEAGTYRLVVRCAGSGTLYAYLKIGETSEISEIQPCQATVASGEVRLNLKTDSSGSTVMIIPVGDAQAAVAYQVRRG